MIGRTRAAWSRSLLLSLWVGGLVGCAGGGFYTAYVVDAPPPARVEVVTVSPGPAFVWIPGYWSYSGTRYVWVTGRWAIPPTGHHEWVGGHWEHRKHGWYRARGHWR